MIGKSGTASYRKYMREYMRGYSKKCMKQLRELRDNKCERCGSKLHLEFAHIKPTQLSGIGRGQYARVRDIKKFPECYALLCHGCYRLLDRPELVAAAKAKPRVNGYWVKS